MPEPYRTSPGDPSPLGATVLDGGVNFSIFSQRATSVELLLFEHYDDPEPLQTIRLHPVHNKTFFYWHIFVEGLCEGGIYAYRVDGPYNPFQGHRFNRNKILLDPYAKGVVYGKNWSRTDAIHPYDNCLSAMKSLIVDPAKYNWEDVKAPDYHMSECVIYEIHVRGFTRHPTSGVQYPGSFDGLVQKIPYLKDLGVNAVELLPVHAFDASEGNFINPETGLKVSNFWGYSTIGFFAPHRLYYTEDWEHMKYLTGFRDMVKSFHREGIEVILDVVFNHTAEGDERGATMSFRGLENSVYYLLDHGDKRKYSNYSGTGNTLNCNHPIVRRMILDCLRYWVQVMHVDGFRFDLASILARDEKGLPMENPPLLWEIESDPVLQKTKIIAEAWDAAGLYQVGNFPGERWAEWNGRYRDDLRRFIRGDQGMIGHLASRIAGSGDLYERLAREPYQSVNYVTCHDGFTLYDLVSYNQKHNFANGEDNRDGANDNYSFNHGVEGPSNDPEIEQLRRRQIKNAAAILLLSQGTPMLLAGDEFCRTQRGNNNAYCQDNEISWLNWRLLQTENEMFRFFKEMIRFRKDHSILRRRDYFWGERDHRGWTEITWHGIELEKPDWGHNSHSLAFTLSGFGKESDIHVLLNEWISPLTFQLPVLDFGQSWYRSVDTFLFSPNDISDPGNEPKVSESSYYTAAAHSVVVLISR
jgi:glycogen operon protein